MEQTKDIVVVGTCLGQGENFVDVRFKGHYNGQLVTLIRVYHQGEMKQVKRGAELIFHLQTLCLVNETLETKLLRYKAIA